MIAGLIFAPEIVIVTLATSADESACVDTPISAPPSSRPGVHETASSKKTQIMYCLKRNIEFILLCWW